MEWFTLVGTTAHTVHVSITEGEHSPTNTLCQLFQRSQNTLYKPRRPSSAKRRHVTVSVAELNPRSQWLHFYETDVYFRYPLKPQTDQVVPSRPRTVRSLLSLCEARRCSSSARLRQLPVSSLTRRSNARVSTDLATDATSTAARGGCVRTHAQCHPSLPSRTTSVQNAKRRLRKQQS